MNQSIGADNSASVGENLLNADFISVAQHVRQYNSSRLETEGQVISLRDFGLLRDQLDLGTIVATSGCFDPIHYGHGRSLLAAKKLGDTLVVIVNGDEYLTNKKNVPFQDLKTRCQTLCYVKGVDFVIPYEVSGDATVIEALKVIRPHIFAKGGDRSSPESVPEVSILESLGGRMEFGVGGSAKDVSSSEILRSYRQRLGLNT